MLTELCKSFQTQRTVAPVRRFSSDWTTDILKLPAAVDPPNSIEVPSAAHCSLKVTAAFVAPTLPVIAGSPPAKTIVEAVIWPDSEAPSTVTPPVPSQSESPFRWTRKRIYTQPKSITQRAPEA